MPRSDLHTDHPERGPDARPAWLVRITAIALLVVSSLAVGAAPARATTTLTFAPVEYVCASESFRVVVSNPDGETGQLLAHVANVVFVDRTDTRTSWVSTTFGHVMDDLTFITSQLPTDPQSVLSFSSDAPHGLGGFANGAYPITYTLDGVVVGADSLVVSCSRPTVADATATQVTATGFTLPVSVTGQLAPLGTTTTLVTSANGPSCSSSYVPQTATWSASLTFTCAAPPAPGVLSVYLATPTMAWAQLFATIPNVTGYHSGAFAAVTPARAFDSRSAGGAITAGGTRSVQLMGVGGVPTAEVSSVVLSVTVTETTAGGYLALYPAGATGPVASDLNWSGAGVTIASTVTVQVGTEGKVALFQSGPGSAQVIIDVAGYYVSGAVADAGGFVPTSPTRLIDTRSTGGAIAANTGRDVQVAGQAGVPATGVSAVMVNITVTETTTGGYLTAFPSGTATPAASNLTWMSGGTTIPSFAAVKLGGNGKITLYQSGPGTAQAVVDVAGYFLGGTPTQEGMFVAISPARVLDTRSTSAVPGGGTRSLHVLGLGGVPASNVSAVVLCATVTQTTNGGYLTVYPGTSPRATVSNLNWSAPNTTISNLVTVKVGTDGTVAFYNGSPSSTQVIADAGGYYLAAGV